MILITLGALSLPLFFIQSGTAWNTIQFFYYGLIFTSLFTAKIIGNWLKKLNNKIITTVVFSAILIINLPTTIGTLKHYLPYRAPARIPYEELSALEFLHQQPPGIILTYPFDQLLSVKYEAPKPLAYYASTAYVSAMSGHPVYLEDEINLEIIGADWQSRKQQAQVVFTTLNEQTANQFLEQNQIQYLYLLKGQTLNLHPDQLKLTNIFTNGLVTVYQRNYY